MVKNPPHIFPQARGDIFKCLVLSNSLFFNYRTLKKKSHGEEGTREYFSWKR